MDELLIDDVITYLQSSYKNDTSFLVKEELASRASLKKTTHSFSAAAFSTPLKPKKVLPTAAPPKPKSPTVSLPPRMARQKELNFPSMAKQLKELFPAYPLHDSPLEDEGLFVQALSADVVIFSFGANRPAEIFLQNIARAIKGHLGTSSVLHTKKWKTQKECLLFLQESKARFFIGPKELLQSPLFLPYIKELPASSKRFLEEKPLIILKPFETYFIDPKEKQALWEALCDTQASL